MVDEETVVVEEVEDEVDVDTVVVVEDVVEDEVVVVTPEIS